MELKKTSEVELENKKNIFLLTGIALSLGLILIAFEWIATPSDEKPFTYNSEIDFDFEEPPVTRQIPYEPKKILKQKIPVLTEKIKIIDNNQRTIESDFVENEFEEEKENSIFELSEEAEDDEIYIVVEVLPLFPGGEVELRKYIANNLQYPEEAQKKKIQGTVIVRFVVDKDGKISNINIIQSVDPIIDEAAKKVIASMPVWKPAVKKGKNVKAMFTLPIAFVLQ